MDMFNRVLIVILVLLGYYIPKAKGQFYKDKEDYKLGMTFGVSPSQTFGTELKNPVLKMGIQSGIYYRARLGGRLHSQVELNAALRGSKYNHDIDDQYVQLNLVQLELPLQIMIDLEKKQEKHFAVVGLVPIYILQSEFYIHPEPTARNEFRNIGINPLDIALLLGYQANTYYTGLHASVQFSLTDLNKGLFLEDVYPVTGLGGSIQSFSLNLKLYF
jgi:hypothetical protein